MDIMNYGLREKYEMLKKFDDRRSDMKDLMDWDLIKPLLPDLYRNDKYKDGSLNFNPVLTVNILFFQSLYDLVDEAMGTDFY